MRIKLYTFSLLFCFLVLLCGLLFVQIIRGGQYFELGQKNTIRLIPEEAYRGRIFDRNGQVIADNILSFDAVIIPQELKNKSSVFADLAKILGVTPEEIESRYEAQYLNPFTPVMIGEGVPKTTAIRLEEAKLDLPGVSVELNSRRIYPYGAVASHILGYMGEIDRSRITKLKDYGYDIKDRVGFSGIEERMDLAMRGEKGGRQIEVDNRGRQVRLLGYKPPLAGQDVTLTIDLQLQQAADKLLEGKKGAIIVMDARTGEILVLSSAPAFDPNVFIDRKDRKALNYYLNSEDAPLFNRAVSGQFPPGSIFKVVTAEAALRADHAFNASTSFVCQGQMKIGNRYFKCWSTHGPQDFYQAMTHSCDVYFYHLGLMSGPDQISRSAQDLGLYEVTGIDLPQEASGFIPSRIWKRLVKHEGWYDGDTANLSIGQGFVLTTPIQLARMMAAIATGVVVEPHVTMKAGEEEPGRHPARPLKMSAENLALVRRALRGPVAEESGTAHSLEIAGLNICAKTGTAQVHGKESHGWVAGFFPLDEPRYAFCVLLENAGTSHYACSLARDLFVEGQKGGKL